MLRQLFALLLLILSFSCFAQQDSSAAAKYFAINYDNDYFDATDRYYTQGTRLELAHPALGRSPVMKMLLRLPGRSQYAVSLVQDCFTPSSIRRDTIQTGDRPFTAYITIRHSRVSGDEIKKQKLFSEFDIGVLGPLAGGRQTQESIHRWLDNIEPLGWQFQLSNDIVLRYKLRYVKGLISREALEIAGLAEMNAGTLYDDVSIGTMIRTGRMGSYFSRGPVKKLQLYGFLEGKIKAVGYNATLQGGMINRDNFYTVPSENIERLVYSAMGGIVLSYKKLALEYTRVFITPELRTGRDHGWGHVSITAHF